MPATSAAAPAVIVSRLATARKTLRSSTAAAAYRRVGLWLHAENPAHRTSVSTRQDTAIAPAPAAACHLVSSAEGDLRSSCR
jgi:hypothetical protein